MKENSLITLYSPPPGDTQSTSVVYIKGMLRGRGWGERDNDDFRAHWRITRNMVPLHVRFTSKLQIVV